MVDSARDILTGVVAAVVAIGGPAIGWMQYRAKARESHDTNLVSRAKTENETTELSLKVAREMMGELRVELAQARSDMRALRDSIMKLEATLNAMATRLGMVEDTRDRALDDLERVRGERDLAKSRVEQLEGDRRQDLAVTDAARRTRGDGK